MISVFPPAISNIPRSGKKLKRRLEDLERRAGSTSPPPEQQNAQIPARNQRSEDNGRKKRTSRQDMSPPGMPSLPSHPTGPPFTRDDPSGMFARQHTRQHSTSPPPAFTYSFPASEPPSNPPHYPQHAPFQSVPYPEYSSQPFYLPPLPTARPHMGPLDPTPPPKPEPSFPEDDLPGHFNMNYSGLGAGVDVAASQAGPGADAYHVKWSPSPAFQPLSPPLALH